MAVTTYRVTARRSGNWWALDVPDLPGVHSQTKRLDQAEAEVREAIAVMLDCEEDSFDIEIEPDLGGDLKAAMANLAEAKLLADAAADVARQELRRTVVVLTAALSQRDVGTLLGISFQRVHQIRGEALAASSAEQAAVVQEEAKLLREIDEHDQRLLGAIYHHASEERREKTAC